MELFAKLFSSLLVFVYHCFDRIVIHGYLSGLARPENVVYFFHRVVGLPVIGPEVLASRTKQYQAWVEAYARKQRIPIEWAGKGVRKEDYVLPHLRKMERAARFGVYFIFKSMEQGPTFRSARPKFPTADPNYRILSKQRSRFTHYYFYLRDEGLGAMVLRVASFLPFQATAYLNGHNFMEQELRRLGVGFRKSDNAFVSVSDPLALQAAADRLSPQIIHERLERWVFQLGPKFSRRERAAINLRRFYAVSQIEYCRNLIFRRHFPIRKIFQRACEMGLAHITADKISQIFGFRLTRKLRGRLQTTLEKMDHGHHIVRAYAKNAFVKMYEKLGTFLRLEVCSNNLTDFGLRKGLPHLAAVRSTLAAITDRWAALQAGYLNVHFDFPLFERLARPLQSGTTRIPGIKIHDTRLIRLMELFLHQATAAAGWRSADLHAAVLKAFRLPADSYRLSQLRYDLRKMKAHGLLERDGSRYAYRLTDKGRRVALLFVLFHKRICGPLANSLFHHRPSPTFALDNRLEAAYHRADHAVDRIIQLLAA